VGAAATEETPSLSVGEVIRRYGDSFITRFGDRLTPTHRKVLGALAACRTAEMGARVEECDHCGEEVILYNSCNDRHCPTCQGGKRAAWLEARQQELLLTVEYFHVVFTVTDELHAIALAHPKTYYGLLFRAVRETLLEIAASPDHLDAQIGGWMVLHTWGQRLDLHPHVHVIVPGGGISPARDWISCPRGFFLPVWALSRKFRGKLLDLLKRSHAKGELPMSGGLAHLDDTQRFAEFLSPLYDIEWVVWADPPEASPEVVLKYLARYTYRVAISNSRIVSIFDGKVTFRYKDYARGGQWDTMTLDADKFLRRFCLHVLPRGFVRIRSFGILANCHRAAKLALSRQLLRVPAPTDCAAPTDQAPDESSRCPHCGQGTLRCVRRTRRPRVSELVAHTYQSQPFDSS
jgi:hypothetical protein